MTRRSDSAGPWAEELHTRLHAHAAVWWGLAYVARHVTDRHCELYDVEIKREAARAWQLLPAASSSGIVNPLFLSFTASHDVASDICQALPCGVGWRRIWTRCPR